MASISLLITYYNEKKLLTDCLQSVYKQTVLPDEILVYDDASKYPAENYVPSHPDINVKVIRGKENIMVAAARNRLMKEATSEYLHYQDADDLLEPDCIEIIKKKIDEYSPELVINEVRSVSFDDNSPVSNAVMSLHSIKNDDLLDFAIAGALLAPSTTFKKSLGLKLDGYKAGKLLQCEDYEFNIRLVHYATSLQLIKKPLVIQRIRNNSMSSNTNELYVEGVKALRFLLAELPEKYHQSIAKRASSMGRILFQNGFHEDAKKAFQFAKSVYSQPFLQENFLYKFLSKVFGQYNAEKISVTYRRFLPRSVRQKLSI
jgi:glycosyltransferase involved in cell wall biosynthesis